LSCPTGLPFRRGTADRGGTTGFLVTDLKQSSYDWSAVGITTFATIFQLPLLFLSKGILIDDAPELVRCCCICVGQEAFGWEDQK